MNCLRKTKTVSIIAYLLHDHMMDKHGNAPARACRHTHVELIHVAAFLLMRCKNFKFSENKSFIQF